MEERGGITFHRITATGTEIGAPQELQSPGTASTEYPQLVVSGENVYVAWIQGSLHAPEMHAVVATSHDGGRTFEQAVTAGAHDGRRRLRPPARRRRRQRLRRFVDNRGRAVDGGQPRRRPHLPLPGRDLLARRRGRRRRRLLARRRRRHAPLGVADRRVRHRHAPLDRRRAHARAAREADRRPRPRGVPGRADGPRQRRRRRDRLQQAVRRCRARTRPAPTGATSRRS